MKAKQELDALKGSLVTDQLPLFVELPHSRSPLCAYETHCGALATFGEPRDLGGCVNREIVCDRCGVSGVESTKKQEAA